MKWTIDENDVLMDAIEQGGYAEAVIKIALTTTNRSEKSIIRRLTKIGYLRNCGRSFTGKQGFVSK